MGLRGPWARPLGLSRPQRISAKPPDKPATTPDQTSSGAEYMRRYRARQAEGKVCITIELDQGDIAVLLEAKTLNPRRDCHTRDALAQAVKTFLRAARYA